MELSKVTIITGHYGSGKTTAAINLALLLRESGKSCVIADLDIVNPYFRTADFKELFETNGIKLAVSDYANTNLDIPSVNLNIKGMLNNGEHLVIDVGGDDEGAKALGRFAPDLREVGYEMYYVVNCYRYLTRRATQAVALMREIENASGLECTGIINNSNLGRETAEEHIAASIPFAEETARITGLPLVSFPCKVYVKPIWEM